MWQQFENKYENGSVKLVFNIICYEQVWLILKSKEINKLLYLHDGILCFHLFWLQKRILFILWELPTWPELRLSTEIWQRRECNKV